jgi:hypothetical protein
MKYIFKQIDNVSGANAVTTIEFDADTISTILEHFEMFLRGSGFAQSGTLDFVDEEDDPAYEFDNGPLTEEQLDQIKETHEWTQTLRSDSEWPFPRQRPAEGESRVEPWPGVAPSVSSQYVVTSPKGSDAN